MKILSILFCVCAISVSEGICKENQMSKSKKDKNLEVRAAKIAEIEWINQRYDEAEFVHSVFEKEVIAIAEVDGQKAGVGRLVSVNKGNLELGGMYVFESFRGKGIAGKIIEFLLRHVDSQSTVYCIPFQHLVPFYERYGFRLCSDYTNVPEEVLKKFQWCQERYANPTSLLVLHKSKK